MSKERARRRAEREREAAMKVAARAAEQERRERRLAMRRAVTAHVPGRLRTRSAGRPTGLLAQRRSARRRGVAAALVFLNLVVWLVRPDWPARLSALLITLLALPLLLAFTA